MTNFRNAAQRLSRRSVELVQAGDRNAWLDLFDDEAVVEDPVGVSPFDPSGKGHKGRAAIAAFYDRIIAPAGKMEPVIHASYPCGDECANVFTARFKQPDGSYRENPMVAIYKANAAGDKLISLRAFWDVSILERK
jgi:ketosteroid isomerase-like protein